MMAMYGGMETATVMAMDGTMVTAMEGGTATLRQQQQWMAQQQSNGSDNN